MPPIKISYDDENARARAMFAGAAACSAVMMHEGTRQYFVDAWNSWFPMCNIYFFLSFNAFLFSAYFLCRYIFARECMPRWLKDDPAIMSYTIVATFPVATCAYLGLLAVRHQWFDPEWAPTSYERMTNWHEHGSAISHIHASYQFWNLLMSLMRKEGPVSLVHHGACMLLGIINCSCFNMYHLIYAGGVAEISTVILTFMDIFKLNPYLQEKYPSWNLAIRVTFCAAFLLLRVVIWLGVTFFMFSDMIKFAKEPKSFNQPWLHIGINTVAVALLTVIQMIWAQLVVRGILKVCGLSNEKGGPATVPSRDKEIDANSRHINAKERDY